MDTTTSPAHAMSDFVVDTPLGRFAGLRTLRPAQGERAESAPRVLALHGWLDNAASFLPLSAQLQGIELVALDLPGHGASAHLPLAADYSMVTFARAAFAAADALGWTRFALLGHSLGAAIASTMTAACPERVERLLAIEALGALTEAEDRTTARLRDAFAAYATLPGKKLRVFADVATAVRARMLANSGGLSEPVSRLLVERGLAPAHTDGQPGGFIWRSDPRLTMPTALRLTEAQGRDLIRGITSPTRVIYADPAQSYFPDALRRERATLLPNGEVIVLPGSHHLHMEDATSVAAAIGDFFAR